MIITPVRTPCRRGYNFTKHMDHVAILRKSRVSKGDNLLGDILAGTKTIESRWYVNKIAPWGKIRAGDIVYLKESGCPVTARALVSHVYQYENLTDEVVADIIRRYGKQIAPHTTEEEFLAWVQKQTGKRYCILIFLTNAQSIVPFEVDKTGFGISTAWLVVNDVAVIQRTPSV